MLSYHYSVLLVRVLFFVASKKEGSEENILLIGHRVSLTISYAWWDLLRRAGVGIGKRRSYNWAWDEELKPAEHVQAVTADYSPHLRENELKIHSLRRHNTCQSLQ